MMLHYWFLLPVGIVIATLVMSSGVSGATLWVPLYFLWLGFDISLAFWLGLVTVLFGMGSGVHRNMRDGTYNGQLIWRYSLITIPAAMVGALIEPYLNERPGYRIWRVCSDRRDRNWLAHAQFSSGA